MALNLTYDFVRSSFELFSLWGYNMEKTTMGIPKGKELLP